MAVAAFTVNADQPTHAADTEHQTARPLPASAALAALCTIARYHQMTADPAALAHQLGLDPTH